MNKEVINFLSQAYPVGAIYISTVATPPSELFGGTWESIGGRFLIGANSTYTIGSTGGEATHKLTVSEMPSHSHSLTSTTGYDDMNFINGTGEFMIQNSDTTVGWESAVNAKKLSGTTGSTGSATAHNNMPPYLVVYMWKRTK